MGAGIFTLLGQVAQEAGHSTTEVVIIAGCVAMLSGYSYARLARAFPGAGGPNIYFRKAFGTTTFSGGSSIIYYVTLMVGTAMVAKAFGSYALRLFNLNERSAVPQNLLAAGLLILLVLINILGTKDVGTVQKVLVAFKLTILAILACVGAARANIHASQLFAEIGIWPLLHNVGLIFLAYAGFGVITNASGSVPDPTRTIPRALYFSIGVVTVLYVALAVIVLASISPRELALHGTTAVAQAAKPVLGAAGFLFTTLAALAATTSAANGMLFGGLTLASDLANAGQLPRWFAQGAHRNVSQGFLWSVAALVVMVLFIDFLTIANVASAAFLMTYLSIQIAHWRVRNRTNGSAVLIVLGAITVAAVLGGFLVSLYRSQPESLLMILLFFAVGYGVEAWVLKGAKAGLET